MKKRNTISHFLLIWIFIITLNNNSMQPIALGDLVLNPPPDVEKAFLLGNNTCWMATASNMLAAAGYGTGLTVQDRAEDIYADMVVQYGTATGGWPDTALTWWINSTNNNFTSNRYKSILQLGPKNQTPWLNPNGARIIGNHLRDWEYVGLVIYNPFMYHVITAWGDEGNMGQLTSNPSQVWITDSDTDPPGGDVQKCTYDLYSATNGWMFDYSTPHVTLEGIAVLRPVDTATDQTNTQVVVGSYKLHQDDSQKSATDLHYVVGTDVDILSYRTEIDWPRPNNPVPPVISEDSPRRNLTVDWDLTGDPVPYSNWVIITTRFVVPTWNAVKYSDVHWTYPQGSGSALPAFKWAIETPMHVEPDKVVENITGGYVIGSFDLFSDPLGTDLVGQFRGEHEYDYFQDPEDHLFELAALENALFYVGNIRFGHSYGFLDSEALWDFDEWMTESPEIQAFVPGFPISIHLDWEGRLPYPQAPGPMPAKALNPNPADGAVHRDTWAGLRWSGGIAAVSHDVYLGDNFDDVNVGADDTFLGNQASTFLTVGFPGFPYPDGLVPGTTYYWRVDAVNDLEPDSPWRGDIWSFTVPPRTAYDPIPADVTSVKGPDVTLSWKPGIGAILNEVYFGENFDDVDNAIGGISQTATTYNPGKLEVGVTYYWRVDEILADGTVLRGAVWQFTTDLLTIGDLKRPGGERYLGRTFTIEGIFVPHPLPMLVTDLDVVLANMPMQEDQYILLVGTQAEEIDPQEFGGAKLSLTGVVLAPDARLGPTDAGYKIDVTSIEILEIVESYYWIKPVIHDQPLVLPQPDRYAILFSGGIDNWSNHGRYWNDLKFMYKTLVNTYGYLPEHIAVLYADGNAEDNEMPVHYSGTQADLETVFDLLKDVTDVFDTIFLFTTNHGGGFWKNDPYGYYVRGGRHDDNGDEPGTDVIKEADYGLDLNGDGTIGGDVSWDEELCGWGDEVFDDTFGDLFSGLTYGKMIIVMEQCFSGGLIWDMAGSNRVIMSAAGEYEPSYAMPPSYTYDEFSYHFTCAVNGATPDGTPVNADTNADGQVSMLEAFNYAQANDTRPETPHYEDNGDGVPHTGSMPSGGDGTAGSNTFL